MTLEQWVSQAKSRLGQAGGDDSLGYDFRIPFGRSPILFEVKASTGATPEFDMSANEVDVARSVRTSDRYRILFITNVLNPRTRSLVVLPNPYGRLGNDSLVRIAQDVRFRFVRPS